MNDPSTCSGPNGKAPVRVVRPPLRLRAYVFYLLAFAAVLAMVVLFADAGRWAGRVSSAMTFHEYAMSIIAGLMANGFLMLGMHG